MRKLIFIGADAIKSGKVKDSHHQHPPVQPQYQTNSWFSHNTNLVEIGRWVWPRGTYLQRRLKKFRSERR